ncbi:hypothetical protein DI272_00560 [Streptomyces sp. Act143]|uniref:hypothetical protein n=1 Tax=Streptomyces sp. Act143 TaxID=2200760 RepID=UPI000D6729F7|nr:hypothetical protein [Streptomyces sp. Act143]PWI12813.1 hypothetical protein DI272_00560 [Streptomyces sp. Act143]
MSRTFGLGTAAMLLAAATAVAGCGGPRTSPTREPSAGGAASRPVVRLGADGRTLVPGGPPFPFHASVAGVASAQADHRSLAVYVGTVADRLQVREDGRWRDVRLSWTNEQDDNGEYVARVPLRQGGKTLTRIDFRLFAADQQHEYANNRPRAAYDMVSAQITEDGRNPAAHPAATAARLRLPVDATHLTVTVPDLLRAAPGGAAVEWRVRVRNSAGDRTRSGLRVAVSLAPGTQNASTEHVRWSIDRAGRWEDLTGRTYIESEVFALEPGASRTVRVRVALPAGPADEGSDGVGAVLWASVGAPWWPSGPDRPSGITIDPLGTNVLTAPAAG